MGALCGGGGGDACEAESGEGRRGDDGGEDSSNTHVVPLSRIASVGALASLIFTHVGGTSCCAIRVKVLSGAGAVTRPVGQALGRRDHPGGTGGLFVVPQGAASAGKVQVRRG
ncbi:hypothetical protein GCM10010260_70230 [Streptomyces filipinensis]|uniref:Uncharacterized protein n=1 Tax=Streptomyces filipinensis TaxID=66887 RepID=A0A918IIL3_9ACTN|nr:hypothetical protein GCM10010260_70230 [Streptomyces filipinensis]